MNKQKMPTRTHFINKLTMVLLAWGACRLFRAAGQSLDSFQWHMRPHHESMDFEKLLGQVRLAFDGVSSAHRCKLTDLLPAIVVDGKWCVQTPVCNVRNVGMEWSGDLRVGFFAGCVRRPTKGATFCSSHSCECTTAPEDIKITSHREKNVGTHMELEYEVEGTWIRSSLVEASQIRAYELGILRKRATTKSPAETGTCNKDERKGVQETFCGRKTAGILAAVTPCLQIAAIKPMFATESPTQVAIFVHRVTNLLPRTKYVVYDNACGMVRFMRRSLSRHPRVRFLEIWGRWRSPTSPLGVGGVGSFLFQPPSSTSGTGRPAKCQRVLFRPRRLHEGLREPKMTSKMAQDSLRCLKMAPKMLQDIPNRPETAPNGQRSPGREEAKHLSNT